MNPKDVNVRDFNPVYRTLERLEEQKRQRNLERSASLPNLRDFSLAYRILEKDEK
ncbi:hypothetical protein GOV04_05235 [Candidatus Woesearchaeota archaeon]|nr:hypothetical protein [Candidatus Woesearchaeota archaeon]